MNMRPLRALAVASQPNANILRSNVIVSSRLINNPVMINTTTLPTRPILRGLVLALAVTALSSVVARAVPYASCISDHGISVRYYLNEPATDDTVIYDGGGVGKTNALGALTKVPHTFSMTGHTSYKIKVTQVAPVGWTVISDDSNLMNL